MHDECTNITLLLLLSPFYHYHYHIPSYNLFISSFCQDQHGSRFIQQRLEICDDEEKQLVFDEIVPICLPLMTDVFGNYVMQKLFEYGTPPQCEQLGQLLQGQVVNLAMQM
jgi:hypothetical protein